MLETGNTPEHCDNSGVPNFDLEDANFIMCENCKGAYFCDTNCMEEDSADHKDSCKDIKVFLDFVNNHGIQSVYDIHSSDF